MPFTGSHPAAVIPLLGRGVPASALVIGALAPDVPYYLPLAVPPGATHSATAIIGLDLMLGLAVFLIWHLLLVPPLLWIAPAAVQRRIPSRLRSGGRITSTANLGLVCLGLVIGAASHVALDMVTHPEMWMVQRIDLLSTPIAGRMLYRWLFLLLSALGLAMIGWYLLRWWRSAPQDGPTEPVAPALRWGIIGGLLALASVAGLRDALQASAAAPLASSPVAVAGLVGFGSTLAACLLVAAVGWHVGAASVASPDDVTPGR